ncbi:MAG: leucyl aminopeptidase family protein [Planctomycetota bacterium]
MVKLTPVRDLDAALGSGSSFDSCVLVFAPGTECVPAGLGQMVNIVRKVDGKADDELRMMPAPGMVCGDRLVMSPTGPLDRDYDDVRRITDAIHAGVRRARDAGSVRPLVLVQALPSDGRFQRALPALALATLGAIWEPLEAREALGAGVVEPIEELGLHVVGTDGVDDELSKWALAVDSGVRLARDLGGTEPERMAPPRFAELCEQSFDGLPVTCEVVSDLDVLHRDYPLLSGVSRCSEVVERHRPRVIRLRYEGAGPVHKTLLFAGKGLCYDTGGADIKADGAMAGMSRDKGGGAAVAGFVRAVAALGLPGVRVIAEIGAVRNSVGADAFVSDEIITSHAGTRVRIGNTDAEGRLVLADLLSHLREQAKEIRESSLFSIATLTGHAAKALGPYTAVVENGPARAAGIGRAMSEHGDLVGDPCDESRLRREDYDFIRPRSKADDVLSCNNAASSATPRGHQFPAAFLVIASGLDKHGVDSDQPLPFAHIDVAGSATENFDWQHGRPTGRPIAAMLSGLLEDGWPQR